MGANGLNYSEQRNSSQLNYDFPRGKLAGRDVVFLPRHGRGHRIMPSELNHRANIWAMNKLDVAGY